MQDWITKDAQRQSTYTPPPPTMAPPLGWRPARWVQAAPPRELPEQDHAAIDGAEQAAARVTRTVGIAAAALLLVMMAVLFGQLVR